MSSPAQDPRSAFWTARHASLHHTPSPNFGMFLLGAGFAGMGTVFLLQNTGVGDVLFLLGAVALGLVLAVAEVRAIIASVRIRRTWRRAARGEVAQVLVGQVLPHVRELSACLVRTVAAQVGDQTRFVRLAFTPDAAQPAEGPVRMDLFDTRRLRGPVRLHPMHGTEGWAFAVRIGDLAVPAESRWQIGETWPEEWSDGWTGKDERADRDTGWPGDSDGGGGDGDGDGGE